MKNLTITPPKGYEIDKEQSTFENIVFKPLPEPVSLPKGWKDLKSISGYYVNSSSDVTNYYSSNVSWSNKNTFATQEQAEACLALSQLSQLMAVYNDGWVPNWGDTEYKYVIYVQSNKIEKTFYSSIQSFLAFKTDELRDKFLENFKDLIVTAKPLL
jgi:hypothetical protein